MKICRQCILPFGNRIDDHGRSYADIFVDPQERVIVSSNAQLIMFSDSIEDGVNNDLAAIIYTTENKSHELLVIVVTKEVDSTAAETSKRHVENVVVGSSVIVAVAVVVWHDGRAV